VRHFPRFNAGATEVNEKKTDRELLELAANAAGIQLEGESPYGGFWVWDEQRQAHETWNPLDDGSDALGLAVMCGIDILQADEAAIARFVGGEIVVEHGDDPHTATHIAIVRAAAQIGAAATGGRE
jgi:hypothetical protein